MRGAATWLAVLATLGGCGGEETGSDRAGNGGDSGSRASPDPQPAFYITASSPSALERRAHAAGVRFARSQKADRGVLILDFGAARVRRGTHGAALRGGQFFSNAQIASALEAAARGYAEARRRGSATLVYANSNAFLGRPGSGYTPFDEELAREAGEQQARTVTGLDLPDGVSASVGGDVEPGYDPVASPDVSIALVDGANSVAESPYYNVGSAPCRGNRCTGGWTVRDLCEVAARPGVAALPEIYFTGKIDQPSQWADVRRTCGIERFAGVSASPAGELSPHRSWRTLRRSTGAAVDPVIVVFPG